MDSIDLTDRFGCFNPFEKCDLSSPTSPRLPFENVTADNSSTNDLLSRVSISIPMGPEESYDFFESPSTIHCNNSIPKSVSSEEPFVLSSPSHLNKQSSDMFVSFESGNPSFPFDINDNTNHINHINHINHSKGKVMNESVKFVCVRASCRRKSRKCGQQTLQRLKNSSFQNSYSFLQMIEGNHYYKF